MQIRFGSFSLDPDRQELLGPEGPVDVEPQVFALLTFLARNADRVVTKDEIIEAVWDGRIVSDANLNSRINAARKAVGDDGAAQAVIRTFPRRGYRFVTPLKAETTPQPATAGEQGRSRVMVLPFRESSGEPELAHMCEALAEELILELSRYRQFTVAARSATPALADGATDMQALWRDHRVHYVVEGAVRRMGERLRITATLADTDAGDVIWSEQIVRENADLFAVEEEAVRRIAAAVEPAILRADRRRAMAETAAPGAWAHYLRGYEHLWGEGFIGHPDSSQSAVEEFRKAVALDPKLADAHSGMAHATWQRWAFSFEDGREAALEEALFHARRAVELDNGNAEIVSVLGHILQWLKRTDEAMQALRRAHALNPASNYNNLQFGESLVCSGDLAGARHILGIMLETGQNHVLHGVASAWLALALNFEGRFAEAEPHAREAVANPHTQFWANISLILALSGQDRLEEAAEARRVMEAFRPGITCAIVERLTPITQLDQMRMLIDALRRSGLPE